MISEGDSLVIWIALAATFALTSLLTGSVRRYALARSLLDVPNARSSHETPTPRGGGLAIVLVVAAATGVFVAQGIMSVTVAMALAGGGLLVALVGWVDDHRDLDPRVRFVFQAAAAVWAVSWLGGLPAVDLGLVAVPLPVIGFPIAVVGILWCLNLFNFMDGIDGIAGTEAVWLGAAGGALLWWSGEPGLAALALGLAAASAGFLVWNCPPARIFMGDVGSAFLGFCFGALAVASEVAGAVPILVWAILAGAFIFDATVTLFRRLRHGERIHEAHRRHAYQRAVQAGVSHRAVVRGMMGLNLALGVLALTAWARPALLLPTLAVAAALLLAVYIRVESRSPMYARPGTGSSSSGALRR